MWRCVAGEATGRSHRISGKPCEDVHRGHARPVKRAWGIHHADAAVSIIAVADGAGSASHALEAAKLATETVRRQAMHWLLLNNADALAPPDVAGWFSATHDRLVAQAAKRKVPPHEFSCTLLFALLGPDGAAFGQIGDGAIVMRDAGDDAAWRVHTWPQAYPGEPNSTRFVIDAGIEQHGVFAVLRPSPIEVALFTDGMEQLVLNSRDQEPYAPFFDHVFAPLRAGKAMEGKDVSALLTEDRTDAESSDDRTLVLCRRVP